MHISRDSKTASKYTKKESFRPKTGSRTGSTATDAERQLRTARSSKKTYQSGAKSFYSSDQHGRAFKKSAVQRSYVNRDASALNRESDESMNPNLIIGRNPVMEAVKAGRTIDKILMQKDGEGSIKKIASMAREKKIQIQYVDKIVLDKLAPGRPHQGIAAYVAAKDYVPLNMILQNAAEKGEDPFLIILDGIEDPHNLGAILRSADGAGAHGVVIPGRRAVGLTETVAKASAGAIEYVPVAKVPNLASAIDDLKSKGIWVAAVDMDGENYSKAHLDGPLAIVIGAEGAGVSRLIREKADFIVSIPMKGKVNSLNASNAAAIILYEAERQRAEKQ